VFPLPWIIYVKIGICALLLLGSSYLGYALESARFDRYKAEQIAQTQKVEKEQQTAADKIKKEKDAQIEAINNQLVDAISELRKRPSRAEQASHGQSCTGRSLPAEDGEFLIREAARADKIRAGLQACYDQYDALK
jgi:biopolymer transport protein ExbB/TolQ